MAYEPQMHHRRGSGWSRTGWIIAAVIVIAIAVGITLVVVYSGGGSGTGGY